MWFVITSLCVCVCGSCVDKNRLSDVVLSDRLGCLGFDKIFRIPAKIQEEWFICLVANLLFIMFTF